MPRKFRQTDALDRLCHDRSRFCFDNVGEFKWQSHICIDPGPRHQGGLLEHEGEAPPVLADLSEIAAPPQKPAVRRFNEIGDQFEKRALAAAGRPYQSQELAVGDAQIDRRQRPRAVGEDFLGRKDFHRRRPVAAGRHSVRAFAKRLAGQQGVHGRSYCTPILRSLTKRTSRPFCQSVFGSSSSAATRKS